MIGSRAFGLLRSVTRCSPASRQIQKRWMSHGPSEEVWQYRGVPNPPKWAKRTTTAIAVVTWWWFYWNLWHSWPHLIGLYYGSFLKDPATYTDEELGIPPDNV